MPEQSSYSRTVAPSATSTDRAPSSPRPSGPAKATSPARARPKGTEKEGLEPNQGMTNPSGFRVPQATLREDSSDVGLSKTVYTSESMDVSPKMAIRDYKPQDSVASPSGQAGWSEAEGNPLDAPSWRPLKEVSSTTQDSEPPSRPPSTPVPEEEEQAPLKLRFAPDQVRPAGAEVSMGDESLLKLFVDDRLLPVSPVLSDCMQ